MRHLERETVWPDWTDSVRVELESPLVAGLRRVLELAQAALAGGKSDAQLLSSISAIQATTLQAEHEHYGDEGMYENDDDAPF